jgi:hypothetical protein
VSAKSGDKRYRTKFGRFVEKYGVELLASRLDVGKTAVYEWISGRTSPHPANALAIQKLAKRRGIRLSLNQIYLHFREVRSGRFTSSRQPRTARV